MNVWKWPTARTMYSNMLPTGESLIIYVAIQYIEVECNYTGTTWCLHVIKQNDAIMDTVIVDVANLD